MSALFNFKKPADARKETPKESRKLAVIPEPKISHPADNFLGRAASGDIIRPRVTEKATALSAAGRTVLVFEVSDRASKRSIAAAVLELCKAKPEKVSLLAVPRKRRFVKGRLSKGRIGRKAYVYFRPGEKVEIV